VSLVQYHPDFSYVIGLEPTHSLLLSSSETSKNPFFHEACVYLPEHEELYVTSNILQSSSGSQLPVILISKLKLRRTGSGGDGAVEQVEWSKLRPPANMPMPASGAAFSDGMLFCSQGTLAPGSGGLFYMPRGRPPQAVVTEYFGRDFNSLHDVAVYHSSTEESGNGDGNGNGDGENSGGRNSRRSSGDGGAEDDGGSGGAVSFWFTDPCHGFEQDFRKKPQLPCHVYRFDPETGDLRVVADGLGRPTGLCFSPDGRTVYVTDSDAVHGDGNQDPTRQVVPRRSLALQHLIPAAGDSNQ
jgi:gluconolactonase